MYSAKLKRVTMLEKNLVSSKIQHIRCNDDYSFVINNDPYYLYKPVPTALKFHADNSFVRCIMGPYGSSKTTMMMAEIVRRATEMPKMSDGIRRAKWAIIRNTYGELESTSFQSWLRWFDNLGQTHRVKTPILTFSNKFNDGNGLIELTIIFLALDKERDLRKLKSLELTGAYINEACEIPKVLFDHIKGRVHRFPARTDNYDYWYGIILDTNPPNNKHWIPSVFDKEKPEGHTIFKQPPGLIKDENDNWIANLHADNIERLGHDYYRRMATGSSEEFIKVYCLGKYGSVLSGMKVYPEYNDDVHSADGMELNSDVPVYIGMDFGLTPSAVFIQQNAFGQALVVHELVTERLGIRQFIEGVLNPFISQHSIEVAAIIGDPAGASPNENDLTSCFDILYEYGYKIEAAPTNIIEPRLDAVRTHLTRLVEGKPLILINRSCDRLRDGFLGGYYYKEIRINGQKNYTDKPDKNEFSHIHDALQYILLHMNYLQGTTPVDTSRFQRKALRF